MAVIPPPDTPFTVVGTMTEWGLSAQYETTFATEIFVGDFQICRNISNK